MSTNKNEVRTIANPGKELSPKEVYYAAIGRVKQTLTKEAILAEYRIEDTADANFKNQFLLFKINDQVHLITYPTYDRIPDDTIKQGLLDTLGQSIPSILDVIEKHNKTIHRHYFICQADGADHYVYGYKDPQNHLTIKDSFPAMRYYGYKDEPKAILNPASYSYETTGDQYNTTDCGHYVLRHFFQQIGLIDPNSFLQEHRKAIGFVLGLLLAGSACAFALFMTAGLAAIPLAIASAITVAAGLVGMFWAEAIDDNDLRLDKEREQNYSFFSKTNQEIINTSARADGVHTTVKLGEGENDDWVDIAGKPSMNPQ